MADVTRVENTKSLVKWDEFKVMREKRIKEYCRQKRR